MRCPRCQGFMFDSRYRYSSRFAKLYSDKKHCFTCGRNWEVKQGKIVEYPHKGVRNADTKKSVFDLQVLQKQYSL